MIEPISSPEAQPVTPATQPTANAVKKKKRRQARQAASAASKPVFAASEPPTRPHSPTLVTPVTNNAPALQAPELRRAASASYLPDDPSVAMHRYDSWREKNEPLRYLWDTQALPFFAALCQRAKVAANHTSKRAAVVLKDVTSTQAREMTAQLLRNGLHPLSSPGELWSTPIHRVGVGVPPFVLSALREFWQEPTVVCDDPSDGHETSVLGADDWVLTDWQAPD